MTKIILHRKFIDIIIIDEVFEQKIIQKPLKLFLLNYNKSLFPGICEVFWVFQETFVTFKKPSKKPRKYYL
jgi:hypothetical protein